MHLKQIQEYAEKLSKQEGWDKETLETRIAYLKSELDEALQEIAKHSSTNCTLVRQEAIKNLGFELYDVIWNVAEIANRFNIDLDVSAEQKMGINSNRTFSEKPPSFNTALNDTKEEQELKMFFNLR